MADDLATLRLGKASGLTAKDEQIEDDDEEVAETPEMDIASSYELLRLFWFAVCDLIPFRLVLTILAAATRAGFPSPIASTAISSCCSAAALAANGARKSVFNE